MGVSKFKDRIVHFRNSGTKGLMLLHQHGPMSFCSILDYGWLHRRLKWGSDGAGGGQLKTYQSRLQQYTVWCLFKTVKIDFPSIKSCLHIYKRHILEVAFSFEVVQYIIEPQRAEIFLTPYSNGWEHWPLKGFIFLQNRHFIIQKRFNILMHNINTVIKWHLTACKISVSLSLKWNDFIVSLN